MSHQLQKYNQQAVKTKTIYLSRMEDMVSPPNVESKHPHIDFRDLLEVMFLIFNFKKIL